MTGSVVLLLVYVTDRQTLARFGLARGLENIYRYDPFNIQHVSSKAGGNMAMSGGAQTIVA